MRPPDGTPMPPEQVALVDAAALALNASPNPGILAMSSESKGEQHAIVVLAFAMNRRDVRRFTDAHDQVVEVALQATGARLRTTAVTPLRGYVDS